MEWVHPTVNFIGLNRLIFIIELTLTDRMLIRPYEIKYKTIKNKPWLKIQGTTVIVTYFKINLYVSSLPKIKRKVSPGLCRCQIHYLTFAGRKQKSRPPCAVVNIQRKPWHGGNKRNYLLKMDMML